MRYLLVCFLLLFSSCMYAQKSNETAGEKQKQRKGYLGVYFGPSFPVGNFGDREWTNQQAGFARQGFQLSVIDFGIKFVPNFGISATIKGSSLRMDVQELADNYAQEYGGQFTVSSSRWGFGGFHVGPFVSIPLKNLDIDFRFLTGFIIAVSPKQTVTQNNTGQSETRESEVGSSISISLGTGVRYHVSPRMSIMAHVEYQRARPTFILQNYQGNGNQGTTVYQNVATVNTLLGLALRIF
ncbi:MAG: hypothetical protein IPP71_06405 [Bacteroidetes bacterium]|nr:hypothetical protein [Bacteroidota bacterium]